MGPIARGHSGLLTVFKFSQDLRNLSHEPLNVEARKRIASTFRVDSQDMRKSCLGWGRSSLAGHP
jgi:hypothetical protein